MENSVSDHPIQPQEIDDNGVRRFKKNQLVSLLLDKYGHNELCVEAQRRGLLSDYDQILQLIGYSVAGAPLSEACRARVPEFDHDSIHTQSFEEGFRSGFEHCKKMMADSIKEMRA